MGEAEADGGLAVVARDFGLEGSRGWVFRGIGVDARPGSLVAIEGPSGSGRTCLLLALTGRMKATAGTAAVGGMALPQRMAAVRRVSALAHVPGVTDLDPALTVAEHLHERALLQQRFTGSVRGLLRPRRERAAEERLRTGGALAAAGLDLADLPKGSRTAVRDLERLEALRLSVALALLARPRLLGVDDTDLKLSDSERGEVWALLGALAAAGTTVLAVCSEAPEGAVAVSTGAPGGAPAAPATGGLGGLFRPAEPADGPRAARPAEAGDTAGGGSAGDAGSGESREDGECAESAESAEDGGAVAGTADDAGAGADAEDTRGAQDTRDADEAQEAKEAQEAQEAQGEQDARGGQDDDEKGAADALAEAGRS